MKHVTPYRIFESQKELTQEQIDFLNRCTIGDWKLDPATGLVNIEGTFNCSYIGISNFKGIRFGHVTTDFLCYGNNLTSLEGSPQSVGGRFDCDNNNLTSLEGAPQSVGVNFNCERNNLTSLEGAPQSVGGYFSCYENPLTTLKGAPESVGGKLFYTSGSDPDIKPGNWNPEGWLKAAKERDPIYLTLLEPERLNPLIKEDPNKWLALLKPFLKDPDSQEWVSQLDLGDFDEDSLDTFGTLGSLGI